MNSEDEKTPFVSPAKCANCGNKHQFEFLMEETKVFVELWNNKSEKTAEIDLWGCPVCGFVMMMLRKLKS